MTTDNYFLPSVRRKTYKKKMNKWSEAKIFKPLLFVIALPFFVVLVPIFLVLSPFIAAWDFASAVAEMSKKQNVMPMTFDLNNNKWNNFIVDLNNWNGTGE